MPAERSGAAILLVEDEGLVRMALEEQLAALGHPLAAKAPNLEMGLRLAREAEYELAILDVNLNGRPAFPIADVVTARGKALVFMTGYGARGLTGDYKNSIVLQKPFKQRQLMDAIASALESQKG